MYIIIVHYYILYVIVFHDLVYHLGMYLASLSKLMILRALSVSILTMPSSWSMLINDPVELLPIPLRILTYTNKSISLLLQKSELQTQMVSNIETALGIGLGEEEEKFCH